MSTNAVSNNYKNVISFAGYAATVVCTLIILALCYRVIFIDKVPISFSAVWSSDNIIAFLGKVALIVPPLFTLMKLIDNNVITLFTNHKTAVKAEQAATATQQLQTQVQQTQSKINGQMDLRIANAVTAALRAYVQTNGDYAAAYNAAMLTSKTTGQAGPLLTSPALEKEAGTQNGTVVTSTGPTSVAAGASVNQGNVTSNAGSASGPAAS